MASTMGALSPKQSCLINILAADGSAGENKVLMRLTVHLQEIESFLHVADKDFVSVIVIVEVCCCRETR